MVSKIAFVNLSKTLNLNLTFQSAKWDWQGFLSYWDTGQTGITPAPHPPSSPHHPSPQGCLPPLTNRNVSPPNSLLGKWASQIWQRIFLSVFILNGSTFIPLKMLLGYLRFIPSLSGHYQGEKWDVLSSKANFLARYDQQPLNCENSTRLKYVATFL